jgi:ribosome-binding factor A
MKTLPTLVTTANLDEILATFTASPIAGVEVNRGEATATVYVTRRATGKREKILSAVYLYDDDGQWHVMADEGLLTPK